MKKFLLLGAAVAALLVGCEKSEDQPGELPPPPPTPGEPAIEITTQEELVIPVDGGAVTIYYQLVDPAEDGKLTVESEHSWIHDFNHDIADQVTFTVDGNYATQPRNSVISFIYSYGKGRSVRVEVDLAQEASLYDYDYEYPVGKDDSGKERFSGTYYGTLNSDNGTHNYRMILNGGISPAPALINGTYTFDLFGAAPTNTNKYCPPAGTYVLGNNKEQMRIYAKYTSCFIVRKIDAEKTNVFSLVLMKGQLTISYEGDNMILEAEFTDEQGGSHHVICTGSVPAYKKRDTVNEGWSRIYEDFTLDLDGAVSAAYSARPSETGTHWEIGWEPASKGESLDGLWVELIAQGTDPAQGIPTGVYTPAADNQNPQPGEYLTGWRELWDYNENTGEAYYDEYGTLYMKYWRMGSLYDVHNVSPAMAGPFQLTNNGDGTYAISFELQDDSDHTFDGAWSGTIDMSKIAKSPESSSRSTYTRSPKLSSFMRAKMLK